MDPTTDDKERPVLPNRFWRDYSMEAVLIVMAILAVGIIFAVFGLGYAPARDYYWIAAITSAGILFILGQAYSQLKQQRSRRRTQARELFLEWHSDSMRQSRIFISRWKLVHTTEGELPVLGNLANEAAHRCIERYANRSELAVTGSNDPFVPSPQALDEPELKEFHFFRIYQFFERWALLAKQHDIDQKAASEYLKPYKQWYLEHFIEPWRKNETDKFIQQSLEQIVRFVSPER
jgi:hypothetical protein